jgi:hypothetical protein
MATVRFFADILRAVAIGLCLMAGDYWMAAFLFVIP